MIHRVFCLALLIFGLAYAAAPARADEVYTFVVKKQEQKQLSHWSLAEWLDTRDRMRLMDMWLALHSPSPYEFFLGGDYRFGEDSSRAWRVNFAAYASIFGLEAIREAQTVGGRVDLLGLFHLRIFGYHAQGTNITLEAGVRSRDAGGGAPAFRSATGGVDLTIYLARYFGIEGLWRHAFDSIPNGTGLAVSGNRYEGTAFIDFSFVRMYGSWFSESENTGSSTGVAAGTRLYF